MSDTRSNSLLRKWRDQFLAAGAERLQGKSERTEVDELRGQVAKLERASGRKTMEVAVAGELLRVRVARSRELVARGRPAALVARVAGISRQAIYRREEPFVVLADRSPRECESFVLGQLVQARGDDCRPSRPFGCPRGTAPCPTQRRSAGPNPLAIGRARRRERPRNGRRGVASGRRELPTLLNPPGPASRPRQA